MKSAAYHVTDILHTFTVSGRIQVTKATAELLSANGKKHWVEQREDAVRAKGKGKTILMDW